jgi:hypothetical protein
LTILPASERGALPTGVLYGRSVLMFGPRAALAVPICLLVCISATATTKIPPDTGVLTDVVDTVKVVADRPDPLDEIRELPTRLQHRFHSSELSRTGRDLP